MFELLETLKQQNKSIGFTCGTFDVLHPGHVMMLEESKANVDYLVVGLLSDPTISRPKTKNKPVQSMLERFIQLQSIKAVDLIVPFDTEGDIEQMIEMIRPSIRFVGEEYKGTDFTGRRLCKDMDIEIFYNKRSHKYSSTELRSRMPIPEPTNKPGARTRRYPTDLKVGDWVWDDAMKQPIKITGQESVNIHKSTYSTLSSRTRFATEDEIDSRTNRGGPKLTCKVNCNCAAGCCVMDIEE